MTKEGQGAVGRAAAPLEPGAQAIGDHVVEERDRDRRDRLILEVSAEIPIISGQDTPGQITFPILSQLFDGSSASTYDNCIPSPALAEIFMESAIKQLPPETQFFILLILCFAIIFHVRFTDNAAHNGPTILTTLGIFATFCGVALALWQFNTTDIQGSVPSLLNGLKTAFVSSAIGIFWALTLKVREYFSGVQSISDEFAQHQDATVGDIVVHLRKVTNALVGSEEGSLISQIRLARQDSNDRLDALKAAQTETLAKLSELGSKALVEALRDVIRDFNQKLTEQFGENFKQLNDAVGRLLTWQEQYKEIVEITVQKFSKVEALMAKATSDYALLVEKSDSLVRAGDNLNTRQLF
jgi:hypothetical protein